MEEFAGPISGILNLVLYLALFPASFFWLRRAWRIFIKHDYSEVALKKGESPPNPKKWAPFTGLVNFTAGIVAAWIAIGIPLWIATGILIGPFGHFNSWIEIAGITLWMKIIFDYIISRQAHPFKLGKKKASQQQEK